MKASQLFIPTQKELPNDAQIISHKLMIKAGLISKLASGLYTWLPLGLMVVRNIENIVREEMNKTGAQELLMPIVQPTELWQQTGRLDDYGEELLRFDDRHNRNFCLSPTHEEVITHLASQYINSYKQLPINFYQIQTKFRDEIRPRFGIMRAREFIMKDAYSFHLDKTCLQKTYTTMRKAYCAVFDKLSLDYRVVLADSGAIGGDSSHEFCVLANSGEDEIAFCENSDYAANIESVELKPAKTKITQLKPLKLIDTPDIKTVDEVASFLQTNIKKTIKTLIITDAKQQFFAVVLRGDHSLNEVKLNKLKNITAPIKFANKDMVKQKLGCDIGSIGVVDNPLPLLVDYSAAALSNFTCGANVNDKHYINCNWGRDATDFKAVDIRRATAGDNSPDGKGKLVIKRGIEVGHIFQLGQKYTQKLGANVIDKNGQANTLVMGCYGIGITRLVGAIIEQNHDDWGIIFPEAIAPIQLIIVPINYHKSHRVRQYADKFYQQCLKANIKVMLDDRKERPGILFAQSELLGIPHRIVVSDSLIDSNQTEYKARTNHNKELLNNIDTLAHIKQKLQ